eukprot:SM000075S21991  [mRNA]  locus=s75:619815:622041:+ [translate_table: standard]
MAGKVDIIDKLEHGTLVRVELHLSLPPKPTASNLGAEVADTPQSPPDWSQLRVEHVGAWSDAHTAWTALVDRGGHAEEGGKEAIDCGCHGRAAEEKVVPDVGEADLDLRDGMSKEVLHQSTAGEQGVHAETGYTREGGMDMCVQAAEGDPGALQGGGGLEAGPQHCQESLPRAVASTSEQPIVSSSVHRPSAAKPGASSEARLDGFRILVVEDTKTAQILAVRMLEIQGVHVVAVNNGQEAVDAVKEAVARHRKQGILEDPFNSRTLPALNSETFKDYPFHGILMDCQMPVMDGYEAAKTIRDMEHGTGRRVAIVACTANAMMSAKEKSLQAGMDAHFTKPLRVNLLVSKFRDLVLKEHKNRPLDLTEHVQGTAS